MAMKPRIAILIDAENVDARHWPTIRDRAATLGPINICRLFGNFAGNQRGDWRAIAEREGLQVMMQFDGNNAADITMTIHAMDLVYNGKIEGICLASSDRDFLPLVQRLRSAGLKVYGFGKAQTSQVMQRRCTEFTVLPETSVRQAA